MSQYNSWFTFSEYEEAVALRSSRQIHARELATVSALFSNVFYLVKLIYQGHNIFF